MDTPTFIDLTRYCGPVTFQDNEGTCVQNALSNVLNYQTRISGATFTIDRQFSYQSLLDAEGFPNTDHGTVLSVMWQQAKSVGFIHDTGLYGPSYIGVQPTAAQYAEAKTHIVSSFTHITPSEIDLNYLSAQIDDLLNQDQPIILSFALRQGFVDSTGINSGALLGGHAVSVFGDRTTLINGQLHHILKVASWGTQYGSNGYYDLDLQASFGTPASKVDLISLDSVNGFNGQNWHGDANSVNVAELYNSILKRAPETAAFVNLGSALNTGSTMEDAAGWLLASKEFQKFSTQTTTNGNFVDFLFQNIQGRNPLQAGHDFWTSYLDNGGSRAHLVAEMIHNTQDTAEWAYSTFVGSNQILRTASDFLYNRATASIDLSLHMQDTGNTTQSAALLSSVLLGVTSDPNSVQVALVGIPEQLGYNISHTHII